MCHPVESRIVVHQLKAVWCCATSVQKQRNQTNQVALICLCRAHTHTHSTQLNLYCQIQYGIITLINFHNFSFTCVVIDYRKSVNNWILRVYKIERNQTTKVFLLTKTITMIHFIFDESWNDLDIFSSSNKSFRHIGCQFILYCIVNDSQAIDARIQILEFSKKRSDCWMSWSPTFLFLNLRMHMNLPQITERYAPFSYSMDVSCIQSTHK